MLKLYYVPNTRSNRPRWVLEELGHPYELVKLDPAKGENKKPEYLAIQPLGHVPALESDGFTMFESLAICVHLAQHFGKGSLWPQGEREQASVLQWAFFAATELEHWFGFVSLHTRYLPEADRHPKTVEVAKGRLEGAFAALDKAVAKDGHLVGGKFTIADLVVAAVLRPAETMYGMELPRALSSWLKAMMERPAAKKAYA